MPLKTDNQIDVDKIKAEISQYEEALKADLPEAAKEGLKALIAASQTKIAKKIRQDSAMIKDHVSGIRQTLAEKIAKLEGIKPETISVSIVDAEKFAKAAERAKEARVTEFADLESRIAEIVTDAGLEIPTGHEIRIKRQRVGFVDVSASLALTEKYAALLAEAAKEGEISVDHVSNVVVKPWREPVKRTGSQGKRSNQRIVWPILDRPALETLLNDGKIANAKIKATSLDLPSEATEIVGATGTEILDTFRSGNTPWHKSMVSNGKSVSAYTVIERLTAKYPKVFGEYLVQKTTAENDEEEEVSE